MLELAPEILMACAECQCPLVGYCTEQILTLTRERDEARIELVNLREHLEPLQKIAADEFTKQSVQSQERGGA